MDHNVLDHETLVVVGIKGLGGVVNVGEVDAHMLAHVVVAPLVGVEFVVVVEQCSIQGQLQLGFGYVKKLVGAFGLELMWPVEHVG